MVKSGLLKLFQFAFRIVILSVLIVSQVFANASTSVNYDYYRQQQDFFKKEKSKWDRFNPFHNSNIFQDQQEVEKFINHTSSDRFAYIKDSQSNDIFVFDKENGLKHVATFPVTTREEILSYSPKNLKQKMASIARNVYHAGSGGVKHTMMNLPVEAGIFYMALGAVSAGYLIANVGQNPAALNIFHEQQTSAVGLTGLTLFLASQNATSAIAQLAIKNPRWHLMLPYLGMTVGAMVQNYATGLMTDPNVKACMQVWWSGKASAPGADEDPCELAYEYFTMQKPWEYAPALTSMLVSTTIATAAQYTISTAAMAVEKKITQKVIQNAATREVAKISLLRVAAFVNPPATGAFLAVTGVWLYLTKFSNLAVFAALDHQIMNTIIFSVRNLQESYSVPFANTVKKTSDELFKHIEMQKRNQWAISKTEENCKKFKRSDCTGFYEELSKFQRLMKVWRTSNMNDIVESHQSWQTFLGSLVTKYLYSKEYYSRFVGEAKKYLNPVLNEENKLSRIYPLFGINTKKTKEFDETHYTDPHLPESEQLLEARKFAAEMVLFTEAMKKHAGNLYNEDLGLYLAVQKYFKKLPDDIDAEKKSLGTGLIYVLKWLQKQEAKGKTAYTNYQLIKARLMAMGNPQPMLYPGEGFLASLKKSPLLKSLSENINLDSENSLRVKYSDYSQVVMRNMICGPDSERNEKIIDWSWGFQSEFRAPLLTDGKYKVKNLDSLCDERFGVSLTRGIYGGKFVGPIAINPKYPLVTYTSALEFLKFNLKEALYKTEFDIWWKKNTEDQMTAAFEDFQKKYEQIIVKLHGRLNTVENSNFNLSNTVANGIMINVFQELRVYLMLLGEILKDHMKNQGKENLANSPFLERVPEKNVIPMSESEKSVSIPEIVKYQARGSFMNFDNIVLNHSSKDPNVISTNQPTVFKIQKDFEKLFSTLNWYLKQISVKEENGKKIIVGEIANSDLDKVTDEVEKLATDLATILGVDQKLNPPDVATALLNGDKKNKEEPKSEGLQQVVQLNDGTKEIVVKLLTSIQELSYEVKSYAVIMNAVSWNNLNNIKRFSEEKMKHEEKMQEMLKQLKANPKFGAKQGS